VKRELSISSFLKIDSDESGHSEIEFYYLEEVTLNQMTPINLFTNFIKKASKKINMLFSGFDPYGKKCALGLDTHLMSCYV